MGRVSVPSVMSSAPLPQFPATRWSIVFHAAGSGSAARAALDELCRLYWFPLYAFARQRGFHPEDAEDETQAFLLRVVEGNLFTAATPERGRLRTFLLAAFQRDLADSTRRAASEKRGGRIQFVHIDLADAEQRADFRSADPAAAYDRAFAVTCLHHATVRLEEEYRARGRADLFRTLRPFLDPEAESSHPEAATATGLAPAALRQAIFRLRTRFRVLLRNVVADTLTDPAERLVDEEIASLLAALTA